MKPSNRVCTLVAAVALAALSLAGCGGTTSSSQGATSGDISGSTITYWATNQGSSIEDDKNIMTPILADFTKQTGVKVNLEVIGWNDLWTRLQTAIASGTGPDVSGIGNTWAASLQATSAFLPFTAGEFDAIGGKSKFVSTALSTGGAEGKDPTSVPFLGYAYGLYYNKAMFAKAGVQPPTTWEALVQAAKKLTNSSTGVYGLGVVGGRYDINAQFCAMLSAQNGVSLATSDGKPALDQPQVAEAIKRYLDLLQTDKVVNPADAEYNVNASQLIDDFAKGKVAMVANQNNADATIQQSGMNSSAYGVVPLPAPAAGKQIASFPGGINLSVFNNTKHKAAALALVKYLTSSEVQKTLDAKYASLPVLADATPNFTDNPDEAATFVKIYTSMSEPLPRTAWEATYETAVGKAMNTMWATLATGGSVSLTDVQAALKSAQSTVEASQ